MFRVVKFPAYAQKNTFSPISCAYISPMMSIVLDSSLLVFLFLHVHWEMPNYKNCEQIMSHLTFDGVAQNCHKHYSLYEICTRLLEPLEGLHS